MKLEINSIHEAWEIKRALKQVLKNRNKKIDSLEFEEETMKECGMDEEIILSVIGKEIAKIKRDQVTCAGLIRKLNDEIYNKNKEAEQC